MKQLLDFLPVLIFFITYKISDNDMMAATGVFIAATLVQMLILKFHYGQIEKMHWLTLGLVLFFGGLTIALNDPTFIMWKPTIAYWAFGIAFLVSQFFFKRNLLERALDHAVEAPKTVWRNLNLAWVPFWVGMGFLNLYVAQNYSEETWVDFKLFGLTGLTFLFMIAQGLYLSRYMKTKQTDSDEAKQEN